jgi:adenylate cyclase
MAMQRAIAARNADLPVDRRMEFRVGIALDDIIVGDVEISGDGVDIATRLAILAVPGGICMSGNVHDHVEDKLDLRSEDIGPQKVKDIARPIRVYRVEVTSPERLPALV